MHSVGLLQLTSMLFVTLPNLMWSRLLMPIRPILIMSTVQKLAFGLLEESVEIVDKFVLSNKNGMLVEVESLIKQFGCFDF